MQLKSPKTLIKLLCIILFYFAATMPTHIQYPELTFTYDWRSRIIDVVGGLIFHNKIHAQHRDQLETLLPHLRKTWKHNCPMLFDEVFSFFKRGFKKKNKNCPYLSKPQFIIWQQSLAVIRNARLSGSQCMDLFCKS